ncbi:hypothetical protein [Microbacterium nymphoidis]|nr:hypothetical protein [Microbacterium nymphoidis]MCD2496950.1 hypothetical protein [Microbacterium nymphoidis]
MPPSAAGHKKTDLGESADVLPADTASRVSRDLEETERAAFRRWAQED